MRYHRSRERGGERKHRLQRQRRRGTLAWESVEIAQAGIPTGEREFLNSPFLSRVQKFANMILPKRDAHQMRLEEFAAVRGRVHELNRVRELVASLKLEQM